MFERPTVKEWYNPSETSSGGRSDPLEQSCLGVGNLKARRTLCHQLKINYWSNFRRHKVAREREREWESGRERERERECKGLWTDTRRNAPPQVRQNSLNSNDSLKIARLSNWLLFKNLLVFIYLDLGYREGWCHPAKLLRSCFYFSNQNCHWKDMNPCCLHFGFSVFNIMYSLKLSNLT